uniref:Uncharacterized protein n=1 Tax=Phlebotomus papatasi TaxID=29031 RepID=A0A1B0DQA9_PHLPP
MVFSNTERYERHIARHSRTTSLQCPKCYKFFKQKANLKSHMNVHTDDRPFVCDICKSTFKRKHDLNYHSQGIQFPVVLYLDGHACHVTLPLSKFCKENGIVLVLLYPNSTHFIQPLDRDFFEPMKTAYAKEVEKWKMSNLPPVRFHPMHVAKVVNAALKHLDLPKIAKDGFRECGLVPFNPDVVNGMEIVKTRKSENLELNLSIDQSRPEDDKDIANACAASDYEAAHRILDHLISPDTLKKFKECKEDRIWSGSLKDKHLFEVWCKVNERCESQSLASSSTSISVDYRDIEIGDPSLSTAGNANQSSDISNSGLLSNEDTRLSGDIALQDYIIMEKRISRPFGKVSSSNEKDTVTVLFTISASGELAPPMVVHKGQRISKITAECNVKGWAMGVSENGLMTSEKYKLALAQWNTEQAGDKLKPRNLAGILTKAVSLLNMENIAKSGFRRCGLLPFDQNGIDDTKFSKALKYDRKTKKIKESSSNSKETTISLTEYETALRVLQAHVPPKVLQEFSNHEEKSQWNGTIENKNLFNFWREIKCRSKSLSINEKVENRSSVEAFENINDEPMISVNDGDATVKTSAERNNEDPLKVDDVWIKEEHDMEYEQEYTESTDFSGTATIASSTELMETSLTMDCGKSWNGLPSNSE